MRTHHRRRSAAALHTPSRRIKTRVQVTGSEDDLRDEMHAATPRADAPRVPTTQPEPTDPLGFASLLWERTLQYDSPIPCLMKPEKPTEDIVVLVGVGAAALVGAPGGVALTVVSPRNYFLFTRCALAQRSGRWNTVPSRSRSAV